jgi:TatD DNase family protein
MFDAHRHLAAEGGDRADALYCTSRKQEWNLLDRLSPPATGAAGALADAPLPSVEKLCSFLLSRPSCQLGEIGLDRRFGDLDRQQVFLEAAIDLAYELGRSLSIHVVRSDGRALASLRAAGNRRPPILWHGFVSSVETGREAARMGCILSLGPLFPRTNLARNVSALRTLPVAVETDFDGADESAYRQYLEDQYRTVARLLDMDLEALVRKGHECRSILTDNKISRPGGGRTAP